MRPHTYWPADTANSQFGRISGNVACPPPKFYSRQGVSERYYSRNDLINNYITRGQNQYPHDHSTRFTTDCELDDLKAEIIALKSSLRERNDLLIKKDKLLIQKDRQLALLMDNRNNWLKTKDKLLMQKDREVAFLKEKV